MEQNSRSLLTPRVKVFFSTKTMKRIAPVEIDLADGSSQERIQGVELAERWQFRDLNDLWLEGSMRP